MDRIGASGDANGIGKLSPFSQGKRSQNQSFNEELSEQRKAGLADRIQNLKFSIGDNRSNPGMNQDVMFNHFASSRTNSGWQA